LNSGQKDKALESFDKGIELGQTPVVWNNVAYNLAQHNIELDKAAQFAESAISATAATLRNIDLAHLSLTDLGLVSSIGDYWDTLGLVYLKKGDLDKAERFVRAAWLLNQHGEVADHLGQVYEKRGDKERAALIYAEAAVASHSVPETRDRLVALSGDNAKLDELTTEAKARLAKARTFPVGKLLNENAKADFYVQLSPGTKNPKVDSAQFIGGSQDLRPMVDRLRTLEFGPMFPDTSPAKLIRRGTLTCAADSGLCSFTLILPEDVRTLN
jgi:tetratricopeptide (TPR) repeat protein